MGHDFPEKWTNFLNRPVASTSLGQYISSHFLESKKGAIFVHLFEEKSPPFIRTQHLI